MTTATDGTVVNEQWFGPFGRRLDAQGRDLPRNTGVPEGLHVGFTGHEQEDTLGLVDMRGRYYDPTQRRFLTPDPIIASPLSTQAFSPYAYVDNNPLSRIDPTGFWGEAADENGFMDEGDWDLSGMDAGTGASGGAGGGDSASGMAADYDDYDSGDMDFDPGEAMAGQDEQAGNDGNDDWSDSGSSKQATTQGWEMPNGIQIDGPEAEFFTYLLQSAMQRSPSFAARVRHHARYGRGTVRLHSVRSHPRVAFGAANVVRDGLDLGESGEHLVDYSDFQTLPPAAQAGDRTSAEQMLVHEVVEAMEEIQSDATWALPLEATATASPAAVEAAWRAAHEHALAAERDYRADIGAPGYLVEHELSTDAVTDVYIGIPNDVHTRAELNPSYSR